MTIVCWASASGAKNDRVVGRSSAHELNERYIWRKFNENPSKSLGDMMGDLKVFLILYCIILDFNDLEKRPYENIMRNRENFSVMYKIYFVVCKGFQFGMIKHFVVW